MGGRHVLLFYCVFYGGKLSIHFKRVIIKLRLSVVIFC